MYAETSPRGNGGSRASSPRSHSTTFTFDPFVIGLSHSDHCGSTSIIKLEDSEKVFCPLCLEERENDDIDSFEEIQYSQYVADLFEAIDQYHERDQLRAIALPLLEILLRKRPICIKSDREFHNLLRVFYKLTRSKHFDIVEFSQVSRLLALITKKFVDLNPMPWNSIWKTTNSMLKFADKTLQAHQFDSICNLEEEFVVFLTSMNMLVKTYLELVGRFTVHQISDVIFPIYGGLRTVENNLKSYNESQMACLEFVTNVILPKIWHRLGDLERKLNDHESLLMSEMFSAIRESFIVAVRLDAQGFLASLYRLDCIQTTHRLIYTNKAPEVRNSLRNFLKHFVFWHVQKELGSDEVLNSFEKSEDVVETNHKNAIALSGIPGKQRRTLFYFLVNFVGLRLQSEYFSESRVRKVIKCVDPSSLGIENSVGMLKSYMYLASTVTIKVESIENVRFLVTRIRDQLNTYSSEHDRFNDIFSFDERVFFWNFEDEGFISSINAHVVKRFIETIRNRSRFNSKLKRLIDSRHYKHHIVNYFRTDTSALVTVRALTKVDICPQDHEECSSHKAVIERLSATLPGILHESILDLMAGTDGFGQGCKTYRILEILITLMEHCEHFELTLDRSMVDDIFSVMERLYGGDHKRFRDTILLFNDLLVLIMKTNNQCLMHILKSLDYRILGFMYQHIIDYTRGDPLGESVAKIIVTYGAIDYPLLHDVYSSLCPKAGSILNWALSQNEDLHQITLKVAKKFLDSTSCKTEKACVSCGLMYMLFDNHYLVGDKSNLMLITDLFRLNEVRYNPLVSRIKSFLPRSILNELDLGYSQYSTQPPSPVPSFSSSISSLFVEEQASVFSIISQLNDEERSQSRFDASHKLPSALYVSDSIKDPHSSSANFREWEQRAGSSVID